ncbi:structural maintenance of chromosomes protein [Anaeramoeba ignava]|uniref:Structural maintenance of chromosomes protein n=1 Tax=Anaeramoeba ignava TaxID=1746090 RepID=A0A9Q0LTE9_ANAIG|nr:structural maintenance of chromosomes protein [Anaeramoeba ignava]|eukprot:Anaeramoba_ignava/a3368_199.p1 GENE.a3368_199~~a3368_199.p1  ORF type:complete len:361 (+),score=119.20 a3368_199:125-1207(+)
MGNQQVNPNIKELKSSTYSKLIHNSTEPILCIDTEGNLTQANQALARLIKTKSRKTLLKMSIWSISPKVQPNIDTTSGGILRYYSQKMLESPNSAIDFDFQIKTLHGELIWTHIWATPLILNSKYTIQLIIREKTALTSNTSSRLSETIISQEYTQSSDHTDYSENEKTGESIDKDMMSDISNHSEQTKSKNEIIPTNQIQINSNSPSISPMLKRFAISNSQNQSQKQSMMSIEPIDLDQMMQKIEDQIEELSNQKFLIMQLKIANDKLLKVTNERNKERDELKKLKMELDDAKKSITDLESKIEEKDAHLTKVVEKKKSAVSQLKILKTDLEKQKNEVVRLSNRLKITEEAKQNLEKLI